MFQIDPLSRMPVYEQIKEQLEKFILNGTIQPGEQIPSVRGLSLESGINPNTILKAYAELDRRGLICSVPGKGYFVREEALQAMHADQQASLQSLVDEMTKMALAGISRAELNRCVEAACTAAENAKKTKGANEA